MNKIEQYTLDFLQDLANNNNREWFNANKPRYEKAKKNFELFAQDLLTHLQSIDGSLASIELKQCLYRIYRDARFSKNKDPYKTHFGVYIAKNGGRNSLFAGYYFHLDPNESFFGGGIYMPQPEYLKVLRKEIYYQIDEFKGILNEPNFKKYFPGIDPIDKLVKAPVGFPKDFPEIELLKNKHYFASHIFPMQRAVDGDFNSFVYEGMSNVKTLVDFINFSIEH
ncbi:MAG: TIGR02453 family protein [Bacteroidetes bacterium HGW-Bacteroidetes-19]|nr:MAG: TIGR02453 family protein [Bacteroidetes bacterium HGW-Bacteroidetes-20]PKP28376.1 MAG: TIGR02453 family protein [Bacteroidetes bacterium HGW-Bacteroidetes-19]